MKKTLSSWRQGARGEWYVVVQIVLIAIVFVGPRTVRGLPEWPESLTRVSFVGGMTLLLAGAMLFVAGLLRLGPSLTPLPYPKSDATFVRAGPYRLVRHPIYAGGLILALGWALAVCGSLTLVYVAVLFGFFEFKIAREERWLAEKYPDYRTYQQQVKKLIPFIH